MDAVSVAVTPSAFEALRECPHRGTLRERGEWAAISRVAAPAAAAGSLVHRALELAISYDGDLGRIDDWWETALDERSPDIPAGSVLRRALLRLQHQLVPLVTEVLAEAPEGSHPVCEVDLADGTGQVRGTLDLVLRHPESSWVVDYKTGAAGSDGSAAPAYRSQMLLYAALEQQTTGVWPHQATLLSGRDGRIDIQIVVEECERLLDEARGLAARIAADEAPCFPSPEHCRWCELGPTCGCFWEEASDAWADDGIHAVRGLVTNDPEANAAGTSAVTITATHGTHRGDALVTRVPTSAAMHVGTEVGFTQLRALGDGVFEWADRTLVATGPSGA